GGARQISAFVSAAFPPGVFAAVVTGEARLADLARLHLAELADVLFRIVVHVRLAGTVAALAAVGRCWRARILRVGVRRAFHGLVFGVAPQAGIAAHVACGR